MNTKILFIFILLAANEHLVTAGELSVPSSTVGGGGASAGGAFSVRGTVGESIPALPTLTGGSFNVSGGFARIAVILTPDAPRLTLLSTVGGYEISWPLPAENFVLQESAALTATGPGDWTNSIAVPVEQGGRRVVSLPAAGPLRFFRLLKRP